MMARQYMDLVDKYDEILRTKMDNWIFDDNKEASTRVVQDLAETMIKHRGVGLAAPQAGIPTRVLVFGNPDDKETIVGMFNPRIVHSGDRLSTVLEGCLSYPDIFVKIKRPDSIRVRYQNMYGETLTENYEGLTAHIVQHEIDHLDGITFKNHVSRYTWEKAERKAKKIKRMR